MQKILSACGKVERLGFAERAENILWTYNQVPFSLRSSPTDIYLEYPAHGCKHRPKSLREEAFHAATLIAQKNRHPHILFSGGIDSEATLLSFVLQKIPCTAIIIDYEGHNQHETHRAQKFCEDYQVPFKMLRRDVLKFWENDLEELAHKIHCASPQIAALCWVVSDLDEFVVVGDGDSALMRSHKRFFETKSEKWALARWMFLIEKAGCPRFFQYTAELEASVYYEPLVEDFVAEAWPFFEFRKFMYLKPFIMHKYFESRLRPKWTGFEYLDIGETYREKLVTQLGSPQDVSWTYEDAKQWAMMEKPKLSWKFLKDTDFTEREKSSLCQNGIADHLFLCSQESSTSVVDFDSLLIGTGNTKGTLHE